MDLTKGSLRKNMLLFALPLVLTSVFKHSFSFADTLIVSRFCDAASLSAVSLAGSLYSLLASLVNGFGVGCAVVTGKVFGGKNARTLKDSVFTLMVLSGGLSILLAAAGAAAAEAYLSWMQAPAEIFALTARVTRMYCSGIAFYGLSLAASCMLNGMGDSRSTFRIFSASSLLNVVLDLVAVAIFDAGIVGCVAATLLAQLYSAVHMLVCLSGKLKHIRDRAAFRPGLIRETAAIGWASILQESLFNLLAIFAQSAVVPYGTDFINGCSIGRQILSIFSTAINGYVRGYSTALAQNYGAGDSKRVRAAGRVSRRDGNLLCAALAVLSLALARPLSRLILTGASRTAVNYSAAYIALSLPVYFLSLHVQRATARLRVFGRNRWALYSALLTMLVKGICLHPLASASIYLLPLSDVAGKAAALLWLKWRERA